MLISFDLTVEREIFRNIRKKNLEELVAAPETADHCTDPNPDSNRRPPNTDDTESAPTIKANPSHVFEFPRVQNQARIFLMCLSRASRHR